MRVYLGLAIAVVLGLVGTLRAEPLDLEQVAADAKWVAHVDVDAIRASAVAEMARELRKQKHPDIDKIEKHLRIAREIWNFNPCTDLLGVTIYGTEIKKNTGVAIVHAKVDQELLLEKARSAPQHREETYGQYQLHTWRHAKGKKRVRDMTGVFYRPKVIIFGDSIDEVKAALDVLDGTKPSLAGTDSPLAAAVPEGTMLLARVVGLADVVDLPSKSPLVKQIESLALAVGEKDGDSFLAGRMTVKKAALAEQMKTVIEGFRAMAVMTHGDDPEAMKIINALKVDIDGKVVEIEWRAPAKKVWTHLEKMKEMKKARKARFDAHPHRHHHDDDKE